MIKHIFKIIWNERKMNILIALQFILVFIVLWFCFDYIYYMGRLTFESHGFDIDHTYMIEMKKRKNVESSDEYKYEFVSSFIERVSKYPGVESVSFSQHSIPYGFSNSKGQHHLNNDSLWHNMDIKWVTPSFFDVFKIKIEQGRLFDWNDKVSERQILISPNRNYRFGQDGKYAVGDVQTLRDWRNSEEVDYSVIGITERQKNSFYEPYFNSAYFCLQREDIDLADTQIAIRVSPAADKDFAERFKKDMKKQLRIGPYYLSTITPIKSLQKIYSDNSVRDNVNSVASITVFLMLNVFLCIIGTFWFRTQSRRSEIALRIALGSSKASVKRIMFTETLIILFITSLIGSYICLNLGYSDILSTLGVPIANRTETGSGIEQDIINYITTLLFLVCISWLAVWYPAKKASDIEPAEALKAE